MKIWGVIEGPILTDDIPIEEVPDDVIDEGCEATMVTLCEINDQVIPIQQWFQTFEEAYQVKKYFTKNINPIEVNTETGEMEYEL